MKRTGLSKNQRDVGLGETDAGGFYLDPYTRDRFTKDQAQLGHKKYCENRYFSEAGDRLCMLQRDYNKMIKNLDIFVAQSKKSNLSHQNECHEYTIGMNNAFKMIGDYLKQGKSVEEQRVIDREITQAKKEAFQEYFSQKQTKGEGVKNTLSEKNGKQNAPSPKPQSRQNTSDPGKQNTPNPVVTRNPGADNDAIISTLIQNTNDARERDAKINQIIQNTRQENQPVPVTPTPRTSSPKTMTLPGNSAGLIGGKSGGRFGNTSGFGNTGNPGGHTGGIGGHTGGTGGHTGGGTGGHTGGSAGGHSGH